LIQVYTGDGKGKTTAALGLALRAAGHGMKVCIVQFMKGRVNYGELRSIEKLDGVEIHQFGRPEFVDKENPHPEDIRGAEEGMAFAERAAESGKWDVLILDELNVALDFHLLDMNRVLDFLHGVPDSLEVVITGRYAPDEIVQLADLVTEMRCIKHPYEKGIKARKGVEF